MKIKFLGGAEEVGRLAIKINDGPDSYMVDYGVVPDKPPQYPMPFEPVDHIFVTHAHFDHVGGLPVCFQSKTQNLFATDMTINSMMPILNDSLKIMRLEGYPERFNADDISSMYDSIRTVTYGDSVEAGNLVGTAYSAGHIPGSTMWGIENHNKLLVTGDLYTRDSNLLTGAKPVKSDILIMESTYAGKNHEDRKVVIQRLKNRIKEVVDNGGKVLLPAFAIGRTQELLMILSDMDLNVAVDGMGNTLSNIYMTGPNYLRSMSEFKRSQGRARQIRSRNMRKGALDNDVIVSTSGMLDGGPVLGYIQELMNDEKSAIFITGYQVEGTNGRLLLDTGTLNIAGVAVKPSMMVEKYDLSAHAGHDDLVSFVKDVDPNTVILCHGEHREELQDDLSEYNLILPLNGHEFEIN